MQKARKMNQPMGTMIIWVDTPGLSMKRFATMIAEPLSRCVLPVAYATERYMARSA